MRCDRHAVSGGALALACAFLVAGLLATFLPARALAETSPTPIYQTIDELAGKRIAYVNGSVYNLVVEDKIDGTTEQFYPSLADCVAAVEAGKADAAVQLSTGCRLAVNRRGGAVALLPEPLADVSEGYFFPKGSELTTQFDELIAQFAEDGTLAALEDKWVDGPDEDKILPEQDWDAPNGTLRFATSGVIEPLSYVGEGGEALGYDVELAMLIARELGFRLKVSTIPMDSIFAAVSSGKVDFGGTLTETPERAEMCDFSESVMPISISMVVRAEGSSAMEGSAEALEIPTLAELDGRTIGVLNGTINDRLLADNVEGSYEFDYYNSNADLVAAMQAGKIDAFVNDEMVCRLVAQQNAGIALIPEQIVENDTGFIFAKGSGLVAQFDSVLERLEADGTLEELEAKWAGADDSAKDLPEQDWEAPNGTLVMATGAQAEPLSYLRNGEPVGYDVEVALIVCRELGYGLEVQTMDFSALVASVQAGKVDFAGSSITINDERKEVVDFSIPNHRGASMAVVRTTGETAGGALGDFLAGLSESFRRTFVEEDRWQLIVGGLGITLLIAVCAGVLGTLLGFATVLARRGGARWLGRLVDGYQALMGGVPLVVVLMVLYYVVFGAINIPGAIVAILAFTLSFGSTAGTTMWTAVEGIDAIQEETGLALGYTRQEVFRKIIFPQARQQFMPQLMGQFVSLTKDTSVVGYIAVQDLTRASDLIRSRTMDAFFPLIATALIYFVFCRLLAWALGRLARRLDATNRPRQIEGVEA